MSKENIVLVIDAAMNGCGVAVRDESGAVRNSKIISMERGQGDHLMPLIEEIMAQSACDYVDLSAVITTIGPGAFTGLRIGISTARGIALARNLSLYGVTTLQALAWSYVLSDHAKDDFSVLIETKRQDFYIQNFDARGFELSAPEAVNLDKAQSIVKGTLIGDAAQRFLYESKQNHNICDEYNIIDACLIAECFLNRPDFKAAFRSPVMPLYLRPPDVSIPGSG